jgi:dipeptidyl aminopeptidase/acylaminoacyl peptidase
MKALLNLIFICFSFLICAQKGLDDFLSYSFPSHLKAADHMGKIAWVVNEKGIRNVYTAQAPKYQPVKETQYSLDDGMEISQLLFYGTDLIYVRGSAPNREGAFPNPSLAVQRTDQAIYLFSEKRSIKLVQGTAPLLSGEVMYFINEGQVYSYDLTDTLTHKLFTTRGQIRSLRLSPDQEKLAFISHRGNHAFLGIYDFKKKTVSYPDPTVDVDHDPVWSPESHQVAVLRTPYDPRLMFVSRLEAQPFSIRLIDIEGGKSSTLWQAQDGQGSAFYGFSSTQQLFWMANNQLIFPWEKEGWRHLYAISSTGGKAKLLTPGNFEIQYVSQSPDRSSLLFSSNQGDINRQHIGQWKESKTTQITKGKGIEWSPVIDGLGNRFALGSSGLEPASVKRLENGKGSAIFSSEDYPSAYLTLPEAVVFSAADGMKIHGQLFLPKGLKPDQRNRALLFFHGGSRRQMLLGFHHRDYYHYAYAMNQYLASQGYIVLSVNYRSGTGYGLKFREALNYGAGGNSEFNDVLGAGLFLQNHPNVAATKIGLWGGSYGGYLTAMGLARASDMFAAGVDIHGVMDWNVIINNFMPSYNPLEHSDFAKLAYDSSPIAYMDTWRSPVLLIHGDDDRNVPFSESIDKINALRKEGVYYEQLVFPDEVHGFLLHRNWVNAYKATADFFDRMLK